MSEFLTIKEYHCATFGIKSSEFKQWEWKMEKAIKMKKDHQESTSEREWTIRSQPVRDKKWKSNKN
jgi:hypothetical protein